MSTLKNIVLGPSQEDLGRKLVSGAAVSFLLSTNQLTAAPKRRQMRVCKKIEVSLEALSCDDEIRVNWSFSGYTKEGALVSGRYNSHTRKGVVLLEEKAKW